MLRAKRVHIAELRDWMVAPPAPGALRRSTGQDALPVEDVALAQRVWFHPRGVVDSEAPGRRGLWAPGPLDESRILAAFAQARAAALQGHQH